MEYHFQENDPFKQGNQKQRQDMGKQVPVIVDDLFRASNANEEEDEEDFDVGEEYDTDKKMSIRAMNFHGMKDNNTKPFEMKQNNRYVPSQAVQNSMLARASSKLLTRTSRTGNRVTVSSRVRNTIFRNSRISRATITGRDSELYRIDDDEEMSTHRCSQVKRYNIATFFTPDKQQKIA